MNEYGTKSVEEYNEEVDVELRTWLEYHQLPLWFVDEVADKYLKSKGFTWIPIKPDRGEKRPTVSEFARDHKGTYVISVAGHLTSCKDGKFYDIWDCGSKSMYGYWVKK